MAFTFRIEAKTLKLDEGQIRKGLDFARIGEEELRSTEARIRKELEKGRNVDGARLSPYSSSYLRAIDAGLVKGKSPGHRTPNLSATGEMLNAMQTKPLKDGAQIFFGGQHKANKGLKARRTLNPDGTIKRVPKKGVRLKKPVGSSRAVSNAEIAAANEAIGREFFGYGAEDLKRIEKRLDKEIDKILQSIVKTE